MTHQGFIGSLGTSILLVGSAVAILLIVGTIVAFQGFPGPTVDDSTQPFPATGLGIEARPEPEFVVEPPSPDAGSASAAASSELAAPSTQVALSVEAEPPPRDPIVPPAAPPGPPIVQPLGGSSLPRASANGGSQSDGVGSALRETVTDTTRAVESRVENLLPISERVFDLLRRVTP